MLAVFDFAVRDLEMGGLDSEVRRFDFGDLVEVGRSWSMA